MKRVLLTGAGPSGFVGRNLKEALADRYEIEAPPSSELDLCDLEALRAFVKARRIEVVVHAAVHNPRTKGYEGEIEKNLRMYFNLARAAEDLEKLVYFGSGAEFDKRFPIEMAREEEIGRSVPADPYGFAKYVMNEHARRSERIYNLRLFGIFGKYEYWPAKFISNLCCKALFDLPLTVRRNCMFDFLYIDDLAPIVEWFVEGEPRHRDYNVCFGRPIDLVSIAETVKRASGTAAEIVVADEGFNLPYTASNERLRGELPGLRLTGIDESVAKLLEYYRGAKESIDYEILSRTR